MLFFFWSKVHADDDHDATALFFASSPWNFRKKNWSRKIFQINADRYIRSISTLMSPWFLSKESCSSSHVIGCRSTYSWVESISIWLYVSHNIWRQLQGHEKREFHRHSPSPSIEQWVYFEKTSFFFSSSFSYRKQPTHGFTAISFDVFRCRLFIYLVYAMDARKNGKLIEIMFFDDESLIFIIMYSRSHKSLRSSGKLLCSTWSSSRSTIERSYWEVSKIHFSIV